MPAEKISLEKAKQNKLFYVVANVVIWRADDQRCLILKRNTNEKVHPGKYGVPGGKLEWQDLDLEHPTRMNGDVLDFENTIEKLLQREIKEEAALEVQDTLVYLNSVAFVRPDGIPVVLMKFGAQYKTGDIDLSEGAFTEYAWVNAEEIKDYDCIEGLAQEVAETIAWFKKHKTSR